MNQFQVKKERHAVALFMADGIVLEGSVFLAEFAARHQGPQQMVDLLLEDDLFFPLLAKDDNVQLVHKEAVTHIRWTPTKASDEPYASERPMHLTFIGGDTLDGVLRATLPAGQDRLQDFLNQTDPFFTLDSGNNQYVVNRSRLRQIAIA